MKVWNPEHPHHAVWREYTQSLLDGKPKVVEILTMSGKWVPFTVASPEFQIESEYRIARPVLKLSYEVPMPVTEPLEDGQNYWVADTAFTMARRQKWADDQHDKYWLLAGLIYLTEADAQAVIDARFAAMTAALEGVK